MAMADCIKAVSDAMGRPITDEEMEAIATEVQQRLKAKLDLGIAKGAAVRAVTKDVSDEAKLAAAKASWNRYNDIVKKAQLVDRGTDFKAETSVLDGLSASAARNANVSVTLRHHVLRDDLLYEMQAKIDKLGLTKLATSRDPAFELRLAIEMYRRDDPTLAAATGDKNAEALARIYGDALDGSRAMQNREGAFIGSREGYMGRQNWDMLKTRSAGFDKWKEVFGKNRSKDFEGLSDEQVNSLLHSQWEAIRTGIFDNRAATVSGGAFDLAKKVSQERTINFDTPANWVEANRLYGKGGIADAVYAQADAGARNTALMEAFGSTPKRMFQEWHAENVRAATRAGDDGAITGIRQRQAAELFNQISGMYDMIGNHSLATIGANVRAMSQLLHLGTLMTQAIVHIPLNAMMLRRNGVPFLSGMANQLRSLPGMQSAARWEIASAAHAGLDGMFHGIIRRFHTDDDTLGQKMSGAINTFYKINGFGPFMDNQKAGAAIALTHSMGLNAGRAFDELRPNWQTSLTRYGVTAADWDVARASAQKAADGRMHVIPGEIADPKVRDKFQNYVTGEVAEGANEPTAFSRNIATFGTQGGTPIGEIARTMMQFKSFAITMAQRQWGAQMRGGMDIPGTMLLASMMTAFGFLSLELKGIVANRTQTMPTDAAGWIKIGTESMAAGGAFGLFADAFLRDGVRSGGDVAKQLLGPAMEPVADTIGAISNIIQGPASGHSRTGRMGEMTAGMKTIAGDLTPNFWATQAAYNYLTPYMIANMLHPGAIQRHEQAMRNANQQWIIPPHQ